MKRADLQDMVTRYLEHLPSEAIRLAALKSQLNLPADDPFIRKNMLGHMTASAFVLNAARNATLFIHHKAHDFWLQPGGHYEAPGDLWDTAAREVEEETGLAGIAAHSWHAEHSFPFDIDTHDIQARAGKQEGHHRHHDCMYLAHAPEQDRITLQLEEVSDPRWVPLTELPAIPGLRLAWLLPKLQAAGIITP